MNSILRKLAQGAAATALALTGAAAATGPAEAATDNYCAHGTCLYGENTFRSDLSQYAYGRICNHQSAPNDFVLWIKDSRTDVTLKSVVTPRLAVNACYAITVNVYGQHAIQVYGRSGSNWSYGTDPIQPS